MYLLMSVSRLLGFAVAIGYQPIRSGSLSYGKPICENSHTIMAAKFLNYNFNVHIVLKERV